VLLIQRGNNRSACFFAEDDYDSNSKWGAEIGTIGCREGRSERNRRGDPGRGARSSGAISDEAGFLWVVQAKEKTRTPVVALSQIGKQVDE
jgi:hypothetical protein